MLSLESPRALYSHLKLEHYGNWDSSENMHESDNTSLRIGLCTVTMNNLQDLFQHLDSHFNSIQCGEPPAKTWKWKFVF